MDQADKNALSIFSARVGRFRAMLSTTKARVGPGDAHHFAQYVRKTLPPLLEADEARPEEEQVFSPGFRRRLRSLLAGIEDDALAFRGADIYLTSTPEVPDPHAKERADLRPLVRDLDAELRAHLMAWFRTNAEVLKVLAELNRGSGREDDAHDVLGYTVVARRIPEARRPWTDAELEGFERKATRQLQLLDLEPPGAREVRQLRACAWTEFETNYEVLRLAIYQLSGGDEVAAARLSNR